MPRYTVFAKYKVSFEYEVEAKNETEAAEIVSMGNVTPEYTSSNFVGIYSIKKEENGVKITAFLSNMDKIRKIVLKTSQSIHIVQIKNIIRCEADVNYTHFYLDNGQHLIVSHPLKEFSEMLEPTGFFRTHQSHLVNLDHVLRFDKAEGGHLVMADNTQVPVSQRKREELFSLFQNL